VVSIIYKTDRNILTQTVFQTLRTRSGNEPEDMVVALLRVKQDIEKVNSPFSHFYTVGSPKLFISQRSQKQLQRIYTTLCTEQMFYHLHATVLKFLELLRCCKSCEASLFIAPSGYKIK